MAYQEFYELPRHYRLKGKPILGICPGREKPLAPPERERFAVFNLLVALFCGMVIGLEFSLNADYLHWSLGHMGSVEGHCTVSFL